MFSYDGFARLHDGDLFRHVAKRIGLRKEVEVGTAENGCFAPAHQSGVTLADTQEHRVAVFDQQDIRNGIEHGAEELVGLRAALPVRAVAQPTRTNAGLQAVQEMIELCPALLAHERWKVACSRDAIYAAFAICVHHAEEQRKRYVRFAIAAGQTNTQSSHCIAGRVVRRLPGC